MESFISRIPKTSKKRKLSTCNDVVNQKENHAANRQVQMYIDFGQKSFGILSTCKLCEMVWVKSDLEDAERHSTYCRNYVEGVLLCSPNSYKRVVEYNAEEYVVEIKPSHLTREAVQDTMKRMIKELGSIEEYMQDFHTSYLFIKSRRIVGCVVTSQIQGTSVRRLERVDIQEEPEEMKPKTSIVAYVEFPMESVGYAELFLGIKLMWVLPKHRRKGIAAKLIDCARRHSTYGRVYGYREVVYSQPTDDGFKFALRYGNSNHVLAYSS